MKLTMLSVKEEGNELEVLQETLSVDDPVKEQEVLKIQDDVEMINDSMSEGCDVAQTLACLRGKYEESIPYGGMDANSAQTIEMAVEHMKTRLGFKKKTTVSFESFQSKATRKNATKLAMENFSETIRNIWNAIVAAIKKAMKWLKEAYDNIRFRMSKRQNDIRATRKTLSEVEALERKANQHRKEMVKTVFRFAEDNIDAATGRETDKNADNLFKDISMADKLALRPLAIKQYPLLKHQGKALDAHEMVKMLGDNQKKLSNFGETLYSSAGIRQFEDNVMGLLATVDAETDEVQSKQLALLKEMPLLKTLEMLVADSNRTVVKNNNNHEVVSVPMFLGDIEVVGNYVAPLGDMGVVRKNINSMSLKINKSDQFAGTNDQQTMFNGVLGTSEINDCLKIAQLHADASWFRHPDQMQELDQRILKEAEVIAKKVNAPSTSDNSLSTYTGENVGVVISACKFYARYYSPVYLALSNYSDKMVGTITSYCHNTLLKLMAAHRVAEAVDKG